VKVLHSICETRAAIDAARLAGRAIGLVPTMGALHAGHGSLIERACAAGEFVVVSIFVNPFQFNQSTDYEKYPRTLDQDVGFCIARGVDAVFAPSIEEMYREPQRTFVNVTGLTDHLCGRFRPGHFQGVTTVVAKLFQIVRPDRAYFGRKDAQQFLVVQRMAADLNMGVTIVPVETVREADGLAMSSRNRRLNDSERRIAPVLYRALRVAKDRICSGATDPQEVRAAALRILEAVPEVRLEYLEIVDTVEVQPVETIRDNVLIAGAVWIGNTRLIDNLFVSAAAVPESR
jgi:pantoate--beta-alanine ligase